MDVLHELAARVGLAATEQFGFALVGGYAVQAHSFLERPSEDVDLFTEAEDRFDEAVSAAIEAYRAAGLRIEILRHNPAFARLRLTDSQGSQVRVAMGIDWRAHSPVTLEIGAVCVTGSHVRTTNTRTARRVPNQCRGHLGRRGGFPQGQHRPPASPRPHCCR
ncbi:MAG: nucleotidyl transferase AbiEii/AbiGii toxin family protein [Pseudonocardiaceae bacterium]